MLAPARPSSAGRAATLTMRPPSGVCAIAAIAARQHRKQLTKFMSTWRRSVSIVVSPIGETTMETLRRQVDMNFVSCFLCCRAAIAAMAQTPDGGRIVNVAARPALEGRAGANMTAYAASKAAVATLTMALAEEVAGKNILVNAVAPSILDTPTNRKDMPKADHASWPKVEEVARTILFLASPDNKVTRGGIVPVYGKV